MRNKRNLRLLLFVLLLISVILQCTTYNFRSNYKDVNSLMHSSDSLRMTPYLKVHLKNGDIGIMKNTWSLDTTSNHIRGWGNLYDFNRNKVMEGKLAISVDSIVIFETNKKLENTESARLSGLGVLTALDVALGIMCLTNPKACFGSCPTFYIDETDDFHHADAEGFSNAILPSLEYYDIDALHKRRVHDGQFSLTMKNEALETHCINEIKLLAYPLKSGERVYQSPKNEFFLCGENCPPSSVIGPEGDIKDLITSTDRIERFSLADSENLKSREEIYLDFDRLETDDQAGLVLGFRQTLMTTYFIYSAMGYMGDEVTDILAKMEMAGNTREKLKNGIQKELGAIEVHLWNELEGRWELHGSLYETGPISINYQIVPLIGAQGNSRLKVKLVMNKGLWRLDYAALTGIQKKVDPIEVKPSSVAKNDKVKRSYLNVVAEGDDHLISLPGERYRFDFDLGETSDYELFLYSKGYYLEWMRKSWIKDKDLLKLRQMIEDPVDYLEDETEAYKEYEVTMEQEFWNSKVSSNIL